MDKVKLVESKYLRTDIPDFRPGDTVSVHVRVVEGDKERIQEFEGIVISRRGSGFMGDLCQVSFTEFKINPISFTCLI